MSDWWWRRRRAASMEPVESPDGDPSEASAAAPPVAAEPASVNGLSLNDLREGPPRIETPMEALIDLGGAEPTLTAASAPPEPELAASIVVERPPDAPAAEPEPEPRVAASVMVDRPDDAPAPRPQSPQISPRDRDEVVKVTIGPEEHAFGRALESAQGPALDFTQVLQEDLIHAPYGAVCQLFMTYRDAPGEYGGTAFLVHDNLLLTAAHNLIHETHGPATKLRILFDNGRTQPLKAVGCVASDGWSDAAKRQARGRRFAFDRADDFGVIIVTRQGPFLPRPVIPVRQSDTAFFSANAAARFRVCGFSPAPSVYDARFGPIPFTLKRQYTSADSAWPIDPTRLPDPTRARLGPKFFTSVVKHMADTVGGFSGGPLMARIRNRHGRAFHAAVAVHIAGDVDHNLARIIDADVAAHLKRCLTKAKSLKLVG